MIYDVYTEHCKKKKIEEMASLRETRRGWRRIVVNRHSEIFSDPVWHAVDTRTRVQVLASSSSPVSIIPVAATKQPVKEGLWRRPLCGDPASRDSVDGCLTVWPIAFLFITPRDYGLIVAFRDCSFFFEVKTTILS
jgi:hypothetical protein